LALPWNPLVVFPDAVTGAAATDRGRAAPRRENPGNAGFSV